MVRLNPCRYLGRSIDVEDQFCEDCLVPCSTVSATVGPHTGHRLVDLVSGLNGRIPFVLSQEVNEYRRALEASLTAATASVDAGAACLCDLHEEVRHIDSEIHRLHEERREAQRRIEYAEGRLHKVVANEAGRFVHMFRLGKHRLVHGLQSALVPIVRDDVQHKHIVETVTHLVNAVHEAMRDVADRASSLLFGSSETYPPQSAVWIELFSAAMNDSPDEFDSPAAFISDTAFKSNGLVKKPTAMRESAPDDDDSNWDFHEHANDMRGPSRGNCAAAAAQSPTQHAPPHSKHFVAKADVAVTAVGASLRRPVSDSIRSRREWLAARLEECDHRAEPTSRTQSDVQPSGLVPDLKPSLTTANSLQSPAPQPRPVPPSQTSPVHQTHTSVAFDASFTRSLTLPPGTTPSTTDAEAILSDARRLLTCLRDAIHRSGTTETDMVARLADEVLSLRRTIEVLDERRVRKLDGSIAKDADLVAVFVTKGWVASPSLPL